MLIHWFTCDLDNDMVITHMKERKTMSRDDYTSTKKKIWTGTQRWFDSVLDRLYSSVITHNHEKQEQIMW